MRISDWSSDVCSSDLIACQWAFLLQFAHFFTCLLDIEVTPVQQLVGFLECRYGFGAETTPAQAFRVDSNRAEGIAGSNQVRRYVLADGAGATYHGMRSDTYKIGRASWRERGCQYV